MAAHAGQVFKVIFDRLRKESEDYYAGRITKEEYDRRQPWNAMYDKFPTKEWDKMMAKRKP